MEYYDLHSIVKEKGKIIGYVFLDTYNNIYVYRKLDEISEYIEYVKNGKISSRGYLEIRGRRLGHIKVENLREIEGYVYII